MPSEVPCQVDMFTGEAVDTRTTRQKQRSQAQAQQQPAFLSSQHEAERDTHQIFEPPTPMAPDELLPQEIRDRLPPLYSGEEKELEATAVVKLFTPDAGWTWYASEFDGEDLLFGLVVGQEIELGYFSLSELQEIRGPLGLPVEQDLSYQPKTLRELKEWHEEH